MGDTLPLSPPRSSRTGNFDAFTTLDAWDARVSKEPDTTYLLDGLLEADSMVLISGKPKLAHKSWFAMGMAMAVGSGRAFGRFNCPSATNVLYLYREGGSKRTQERFYALAAGHDLLRPGQYGSRFFFSHRERFFLDDKDCLKRIIEGIQQHEIGLVIIDTLAKCMRGDEKDNYQMGKVVEAAMEIRECRARYGGSVCAAIVHHLRKEKQALTFGEYGNPLVDDDIRGATALAGAYESHLAIRGYLTSTVEDAPEQPFLIVQNKDGGCPRAHTYDWTFRSAPQSAPAVDGFASYPPLLSAHLRLGPASKLPYVPQLAKRKARS